MANSVDPEEMAHYETTLLQKNIGSLSSADFAQIVVKINIA